VRLSDGNWQSVPEGNNRVDKKNAGLKEQDQNQEDEQRCGDIDAASALGIAGEDLRSCRRWWRWRGLRLQVGRGKRWWIESRVAIGLEIFVEVFFKSLFERHL
jgi:hypothetical protein